MASGLNFESGRPSSTAHSLVFGVSMMPSTITWLTCTPCGPNSLASDCASARSANFGAANDDSRAPLRSDAVAPVKRRVGECLGFAAAAERRRGRVNWEKLKAPMLIRSKRDSRIQLANEPMYVQRQPRSYKVQLTQKISTRNPTP